MSDGTALLRMIEAQPDDDAPRLIYADWLDEQGDAERAEFIRLECELARQATWTQARHANVDRAAELWHKHATQWLGPFGQCRGQWDFGRGFPEHLTWLGSAEELLAFLESLGVYDPTTGHSTRGVSPTGVFLRSLVFQHPGAELARIVAWSPTVERLRSLRFIGMSNAERGIGTDGVRMLIQSPYLTKLDELHLEWNRLNASDTAELIAATNMPNLRRLNLCGNLVTANTLTRLAKSPSWRNLEMLDLYGACNVLGWPPEVFQSSAPVLDKLTWLNLGGNPALGLQGIEALSASPLVHILRHLDYSENDGNDAAARVLAQTPWGNLEVLDLSRNQITDVGACYLAESPFLDGLRKLIVRGNPIGQRGQLALAKRFPRDVYRY